MGSIVIVSAPSGAGKSTLLERLVKQRDDIVFSVSHTTREPRPGERDGEDYFFVSREEFEGMVRRDAFLEWAEYSGQYYGTSEQFVRNQMANGSTVILDIEVVGADVVRRRVADALSIFILPPSFATLKARLENRATDTPEAIERRLQTAIAEVEHVRHYDYVVVNDDLERADQDLHAVLRAQHLSTANPRPNVRAVLEDFRGQR